MTKEQIEVLVFHIEKLIDKKIAADKMRDIVNYQSALDARYELIRLLVRELS